MAYDEGVAQRVREVFAPHQVQVIEKKMFGGIAFLHRGNMCAGVVGEELMVRVGPDAYDEALMQPFARPMDFTGKPLKGFVYVAADGFETDEGLEAWIGRGLAFVELLPPK